MSQKTRRELIKLLIIGSKKILVEQNGFPTGKFDCVWCYIFGSMIPTKVPLFTKTTVFV